MKLLINGCSFTGGNDVIHNEFGDLVDTPDYVWSNHTGVQSTNLAIAGNSNDKIIRTTLEHLKQNDNYDGVIIQWTALYRLERYIEQYDIWGNICNQSHVYHKEEATQEQIQQLESDNMFGIHFDKIEEDHGEKVNTLDKLLTTASNNYIWLNSDVDYKVKFLQDVLLMQSILENYDMPYLFTSMSQHSHCKLMKFKTDYERVLLEQVKLDNWTKRPMTHMCANDFDSTLHPTTNGHQKIASELMREFKRVNG
tara:strand:- start:1000 stop:1758 length:759 start_codon:yes stop_codon:yes gene_type:complete